MEKNFINVSVEHNVTSKLHNENCSENDNFNIYIYFEVFKLHIIIFIIDCI